MASVANGNTKRYSWWWDSHISPKNSKWLQENLTDMDSNVKKMIKVIEEDADSFARRAEMYYKKRPELMKLVEEFYRAYRALAERYDHATGVIRHAHQTMAEAFPNQDPMMFGSEDSLVGSDEFDPESYPHIRAPVYPNEFKKESSFSQMSTVKRNIAFMEDGQGLKSGKARKGLNFSDAEGYGRNAKVLSESSKAEAEIAALKDALSKVQAEKEASLAQFDQNLERLSNLESEVSRAQEDSKGFSERATKAEAEVETLRDSLSKVEIEKGSCFLQYQQCLKNIADLEEQISLVNERASEAEAETLSLKQSLVVFEADKEASLVQYHQCLESISNLEEKLHKAEEEARLINQRAEDSDGEVEKLKLKVSKLVEENEAYELQYQQCLDTIADLKLKLFHAQEETQRLSREIEDGVAKLKFAEEKCVVLERSNQNLHTELDGLLEKLGNQSHELTEKQKEMGKLWTSVQEEHLRFTEAETAFQTLQQLHSQSQEELSTLALELQNRSQILKDMEARNSDLQEEVKEAKAESNNLSELNISSAASIKILQEEVSRLREKIEKLEAEVELRVDQRNALQQEIYCLKEELSQLGKKLGSSVKELQEENSVLKETKERESIEKTVLLEKLETMEKLVEKNLVLENSIHDLNSEVETIRGKLKTLEESCVLLSEEKSSLHSEKDMLISRLKSSTETSKKLSEENMLLENSLFDANAELEELKSELKKLEDSSLLLNDDKSSLVNERESLLSDMETMRRIIQDLEKEQAVLKLKVSELEAERVSSLKRIEELGVALDAKESKIHLLEDENQSQEREYQMELDRGHDAHVEIIVLQKCLQDWLEKSSSLVAENQKIKEASQLLEKLVSELEHENIGKQAKIESSINCIKVLRTGIYQVLMKLEIIPSIDSGDENSQDQTNMRDILSRLDEMQTMLLKIWDENHQYAIEKLVLVEFLRQFKTEAVGIATEKIILEKELESQSHQLLLSRDESQKLLCINGELTTKVDQGMKREKVLKLKVEDLHMQSSIENVVLVELIRQLKTEAVGIATEKKILEEELESQCYMNGELTTRVNQGANREEALKFEVEDLHREVLQFRNDYTTLQRENHKTIEEKRYFAESTLRLEEEKRELEEDITFLLSESIYQSSLILLLEDLVLEKLSEAMKLNEDLDRLIVAKCKLEEEAREVGAKLKSTENENSRLQGLLEKTDSELLSERTVNDQLGHEISNVKDELVHKEKELVEAMLMISIVRNEKSELSKAVEDSQCRYNETKAIEEANLMNLLMELDGIKAENRELVRERSDNETWESQASTLFGDLQISAVHETLLQGLTRDLSEACKSLESKNTLKDLEIDQFKGRVNSLEDANKGQNDLMSKHSQAIVLLKESVESLEKHIVMPQESENKPSKDIASVVDNNDGFLELCLRIKAIEGAVTERLAMKELKATARRSRRRSGSLRKQNHEIDSEEAEMITKDIILDQVSDCSSYGIISKRDLLKIEDNDHSLDVPKPPQKGKSLSEESLVVDKLEISDRFMDPNKEINKRKVLERLGSDLQKLANLHVAVEDLKTKVEKEGKGEYETVKEQINEAEEALEKLLTINRRLVTKVQSGFERTDGSKSSMDLDENESSRRRRISEQARRGSEKIGRLQLEIQRLQFLLLKLEGEREKAKTSSDSKTTRILLRDYIYGGGVRGERRKRMKKRFAFCGCVQPPPPSP